MEWNKITPDELRHLYYDKEMTDSQIAAMFDVSIGKVTYKRKKFNINIKNMVYEQFLKSDIFIKMNAESKKRLLQRDNIDSISKAVTHFIFRNGPVEDMHANNQLSEHDMMTLNKYMVNKIAGLLTAIANDDWLKLEFLFLHYKIYGSQWDNAEPDMKEIDLIIKQIAEYRFLWL